MIASGRLAGVLVRPQVEGLLHQLLIAETGSTLQMRPVVELTGPTGIGWTAIVVFLLGRETATGRPSAAGAALARIHRTSSSDGSITAAARRSTPIQVLTGP